MSAYSYLVVLPLNDQLRVAEQIVVAGVVIIKMGTYEVIDVRWLKSNDCEASNDSIFRRNFNG